MDDGGSAAAAACWCCLASCCAFPGPAFASANMRSDEKREKLFFRGKVLYGNLPVSEHDLGLDRGAGESCPHAGVDSSRQCFTRPIGWDRNGSPRWHICPGLFRED